MLKLKLMCNLSRSKYHTAHFPPPDDMITHEEVCFQHIYKLWLKVNVVRKNMF